MVFAVTVRLGDHFIWKVETSSEQGRILMSPVFGLGLRTDCNRGSLWRPARALFSQM